MIWYLPDFDHTILTTRCNHVVIVWAPGNVQDRSFMSSNQWMVWIDSSHLKKK